MAFYVKTGASQTGTITCQAHCAGFDATASITVVEDSGSTPVDQPRRAAGCATAGTTTMHCALYGKRLSVPSWAGEGASFSVFDCRGRLVCKRDVQAGQSLDLRNAGIARGVHIIRITADPAKGHR